MASYAHAKTDTVHELTGEGETSDLWRRRALPRGTVTVNGEVHGETISATRWGRLCQGCDGGVLARGTPKFSGAGLSAADKAQLVPAICWMG